MTEKRKFITEAPKAKKFIPEAPKSEFDLRVMTLDQLFDLAKEKTSLKKPFKASLVTYLIDLLGLSPEKALFENLCDMYGLKPSDWEKEFKDRNTTLRITGFDPGKPKNKFNLTDQNGKKFHCSTAFIQRHLGKKLKGKQIPISEYLSDENLNL